MPLTAISTILNEVHGVPEAGMQWHERFCRLERKALFDRRRSNSGTGELRVVPQLSVGKWCQELTQLVFGRQDKRVLAIPDERIRCEL